MGSIKEIKTCSNNPYLNFFELTACNKAGHTHPYFMASRAKNQEGLKIRTRKNQPDGVIIFSLYGENHDRIVLVRQYRYPIDDYIYELPAGLVEPGEDLHTAAKRELHEETGLTLTPIQVPYYMEKPFFCTIGMTDESCGAVYGYATGTVRTDFMEENEEIEIVLADKKEARRILEEENVALPCAYQLMHFLTCEDPFSFLK